MFDYKSYKNDLATLVSFNSVKDTASKGAPFGNENAKALDFLLSIARKMGFETINYDGYAGEILCGNGEEFGIIGHLDIVPVGNDWLTPPLTLVEKDGCLFARGVIDDKGPTLLALYALNELKNNVKNLNKKFRLFVGCNEETGWKDIDYLAKKTTMPLYGFSPDGNFPLTYAEKGIYILKIKLPKLKNFENLTGGVAVNAVCDYATVLPKIQLDNKLLDNLSLEVYDGKVISRGVSAHGSTPEEGVNALKKLFLLFSSCNELGFDKILSVLFEDSLNIFSAVTEQGKTTISPNLIEKIGQDYYLLCDIRLPAPLNITEINEKLKKELSPLTFSITEKHPPMMVEKQNPVIKAMLSAYIKATGELEAMPMAMGGSTFARAFSKGCSFGIHKQNMCGNLHGANEWIKIDWLKTAFEVYYNALYNINNI